MNQLRQLITEEGVTLVIEALDTYDELQEAGITNPVELIERKDLYLDLLTISIREVVRDEDIVDRIIEKSINKLLAHEQESL